MIKTVVHGVRSKCDDLVFSIHNTTTVYLYIRRLRRLREKIETRNLETVPFNSFSPFYPENTNSANQISGYR